MIEAFIEAGPAINDSEKRAFATLRAELEQSNEKFTVVTNVRLPNGRQDFYEYDAIVVGERIVFALEVKGYGGRIECQRDRWFTETGNAYENPSNKISIKAKTLGSLLLAKYRNLKSRLWVQDFVYVNGSGAQLTDADYARRTTFDVIGTAFDSAKALGSALRDSNRWCKTEPFDVDERKTIISYLRGGEARRVEERIGKYTPLERLVATSERYERLLVRDRFRPSATERYELHVYRLDGRRSAEKEVGTLFDRQVDIVRSLGDSGVAAKYISDDAGIWRDQDVRYIAYEWLGAFESLGDRIGRTGAAGLADGLRLGIAIAESIATIHDQGIIHGALEPSSLFIRPPRDADDATPRIAIGRIELARPRTAGMSVSAISTIAGAASCYASPDVLANKAPDVDDDLFSFGAIFVQVLRGRPLFATSNEILRNIRIPRLVEDRSADPVELVDLIKSLLSRSPLSRPRSMRDVATRLRDLLASLEERRRDPMRLAEYRIVRELRAGATGRTVVAERDDLAGEVVLKIAPHGSDETLRHEVECLHALQRMRVHPNVVFAYDAKNLEREKLLLGVFGLVAGEDGERVRGKIPGEWLGPLADGLFSALAFVHQHNLLHRDVKPANVMIGPDGKATLLDFGLAVEPGDAQLVIGTAPYKPEALFARGSWSYADDVFAAATTLWEVATARHPWGGSAPSGAPSLDAADLGGSVDDAVKTRFTEVVRDMLTSDDDGPDLAERSRLRLAAALQLDGRLELRLPAIIELPANVKLNDAVAGVALSKATRRALDDLGATTFADVLRLDNARFASVRVFGRGATDELEALRVALVTRFGDIEHMAASVLRSVQTVFASALMSNAYAVTEDLDVLRLPTALADTLRRRSVNTVAQLAALDRANLEREPEFGTTGVTAIRDALHAYSDDREQLVVDAALPPWAVASREMFVDAIRRIGGDPTKAIDLLELAGGFELTVKEAPMLDAPLVAAPPWTHERLLLALTQLSANVSWPPIDLSAAARSVIAPAALSADTTLFFVERTLAQLDGIAATSEGRWYKRHVPSSANAFAYGATGSSLPLPLAEFLSTVERRLPGIHLPAAGAETFERDLADAGLVLLPNAHVERIDAVERARALEASQLEGADIVSLSAAGRALVAATHAGGYRLVVAEPALYASRTRSLVAELRTALGDRVRVVDVDAELCRKLREAGNLPMALRVQSACGPERDALEAIAGDSMRAILDGLLGASNTLTIAINAGSLGIVGVANHLGTIYDAARGGRYGLVVVCVPGDHPSEHARLNRCIPLPIQPTDKPMALDDAA